MVGFSFFKPSHGNTLNFEDEHVLARPRLESWLFALAGRPSPFCAARAARRQTTEARLNPFGELVHELIHPPRSLMSFLELEQTACACRTHETDV